MRVNIVNKTPIYIALLMVQQIDFKGILFLKFFEIGADIINEGFAGFQRNQSFLGAP